MAKAKASTRKAKLKLFKAVIGFHDTYVAAPSQKAALEAWGASTDLFSAGLAERIDDRAVCEAAFGKPGTIITAKRGTKKEWTERAKPKAKKSPRADAARARIEKRLAALETRRAKAVAALELQIDSLLEKRDALERKFMAHRENLERQLDAI